MKKKPDGPKIPKIPNTLDPFAGRDSGTISFSELLVSEGMGKSELLTLKLGHAFEEFDSIWTNFERSESVSLAAFSAFT